MTRSKNIWETSILLSRYPIGKTARLLASRPYTHSLDRSCLSNERREHDTKNWPTNTRKFSKINANQTNISRLAESRSCVSHVVSEILTFTNWSAIDADWIVEIENRAQSIHLIKIWKQRTRLGIYLTSTGKRGKYHVDGKSRRNQIRLKTEASNLTNKMTHLIFWIISQQADNKPKPKTNWSH